MDQRLKNIKIIAFDADDTLWENEPYFRQMEAKICEILAPYGDAESMTARIYDYEIRNLHKYGYGSKGFALSMLQMGMEVSDYQISTEDLNQILKTATSLLEHKTMNILEGVEETLAKLQPHYKLVMATKGDLAEQKKKLDCSKLAPYFDHIEIMLEKDTQGYERLLHILNVEPEHFLMIGNSPNSDIKPVIELGGNAIHIPYHTTWIHEQTHEDIESKYLLQFDSIQRVTDALGVK